MKLKLQLLLFISFIAQPSWSTTQPINPSNACPKALVTDSNINNSLNPVETLLLEFSNELLPNFEDPIQEVLFRIYALFHFDPGKRDYLQKYITNTINEAKKYQHLLPYKKSFRRFQISSPSNSVKTMRPLSFIESPLRGCIGNDCSTSTYTEIAFHPNYYYFTLTNQMGISKGHITVVLGNARYEHEETTIRVAFIDKVQNVSTEDLPLMIEAIRQSVLEHGYILALPHPLDEHRVLRGKVLHKDSQYNEHITISVSKSIRSFLKDHISVLKEQPLKDFHPHAYPSQINLPQDTGFSRADIGLLLFPIKPLEKPLADNVSRGSVIFPRKTQQHIEASALHVYLASLSKNSSLPPLYLAHLLLYSPDEIRRLDIFQKLILDVLKQVEKKDLYELFLNTVLKMDISTTSLLAQAYMDIYNTSLFTYEEKDNIRTSVLHFALKTIHPKQKEMITLLLDLGANVNARDITHDTSLHNAIRNGLDIDIIVLLLDYRADVNAKIDFKTPLSLAKAKDNQELIELLLERGAKENI